MEKEGQQEAGRRAPVVGALNVEKTWVTYYDGNEDKVADTIFSSSHTSLPLPTSLQSNVEKRTYVCT